MKVIGVSADHMKTIGAVMSYAEPLQNVIPTDSDLVHKTEAETISGQKTFTEKTTFAAETNFNANTIFAGTTQFNGNLKIKNKTIEAIIDERIETNSGGTETDALLPKTIDLGKLVTGENTYPEGITYDELKNADAITALLDLDDEITNVKVKFTKIATIEEMYTTFSATSLVLQGNLNIMVMDEVILVALYYLEPRFYLSELGRYPEYIDINLYRSGKLENEKIYGNKIKLNGTTYNPFVYSEPETLDIDTAIDNKIANAIGNALEADY